MPTSSADPSPRPEPYLIVEKVTAGYGPVPTITEVTVQVGRGEVVSVLGPNGAGKSTLLKAITGKLKHTTGRVRLGGEDISHLRGERLAGKGLGYVPQTNDVFDTLTVIENLEVGGYLLPRADVAAQIEKVMAIFPALSKMTGRTASKLSGGERKMVAIARALMLSPSALSWLTRRSPLWPAARVMPVTPVSSTLSVRLTVAFAPPSCALALALRPLALLPANNVRLWPLGFNELLYITPS